MQYEKYENYKNLKERAQKQEAKAELAEFIESLKSAKGEEQFVEWFFCEEFKGGKIRYELYQEIIFPVLYEGFKRNDPKFILRLLTAEDNLPQAKSIEKELVNVGKLDLLSKYVELCPQDSEARLELISEHIKFFQFCQHEWPSGILYGMNGATLDECSMLLRDIDIVKKLDLENCHARFLYDFQGKVLSHQEGLLNNKCR